MQAAFNCLPDEMDGFNLRYWEITQGMAYDTLHKWKQNRFNRPTLM